MRWRVIMMPPLLDTIRSTMTGPGAGGVGGGPGAAERKARANAKKTTRTEKQGQAVNRPSDDRTQPITTGRNEQE